jgi:hypothetical protein
VEKIYRTTVRKLIALVAVLSHGKDMTMTEEAEDLLIDILRYEIF